jgi:hypothetical protein
MDLTLCTELIYWSVIKGNHWVVPRELKQQAEQWESQWDYWQWVVAHPEYWSKLLSTMQLPGRMQYLLQQHGQLNLPIHNDHQWINHWRECGIDLPHLFRQSASTVTFMTPRIGVSPLSTPRPPFAAHPPPLDTDQLLAMRLELIQMQAHAHRLSDDHPIHQQVQSKLAAHTREVDSKNAHCSIPISTQSFGKLVNEHKNRSQDEYATYQHRIQEHHRKLVQAQEDLAGWEANAQLHHQTIQQHQADIEQLQRVVASQLEAKIQQDSIQDPHAQAPTLTPAQALTDTMADPLAIKPHATYLGRIRHTLAAIRQQVETPPTPSHELRPPSGKPQVASEPPLARQRHDELKRHRSNLMGLHQQLQTMPLHVQDQCKVLDEWLNNEFPILTELDNAPSATHGHTETKQTATSSPAASTSLGNDSTRAHCIFRLSRMRSNIGPLVDASGQMLH